MEEQNQESTQTLGIDSIFLVSNYVKDENGRYTTKIVDSYPKELPKYLQPKLVAKLIYPYDNNETEDILENVMSPIKRPHFYVNCIKDEIDNVYIGILHYQVLLHSDCSNIFYNQALGYPFETKDENLTYKDVCLCISSHYPLFDYIKQILSYLYTFYVDHDPLMYYFEEDVAPEWSRPYTYTQQDQPSCSLLLFLQFIHHTKLQPCTLNDIQFEHCHFYCDLRSSLFFPSLDTLCYQPLLSSLSSKTILLLIKLLFVDQHLILISKDLGTLSMSCISLVSLLYPFPWEIVVHSVPILNSSSFIQIHTHSTYIYGIYSESYEKNEELFTKKKDLIRVFLDEDRIECSEERQKFIQSLSLNQFDIDKKFHTLFNSIHSFSAPPSEPSPTFSIGSFVEHHKNLWEDVSEEEIKLSLQQSCAHPYTYNKTLYLDTISFRYLVYIYYLYLFKDYNIYLSPPNNHDYLYQFDNEDYLSLFSDTKPFIQECLDCMMLTNMLAISSSDSETKDILDFIETCNQFKHYDMKNTYKLLMDQFCDEIEDSKTTEISYLAPAIPSYHERDRIRLSFHLWKEEPLVSHTIPLPTFRRPSQRLMSASQRESHDPLSMSPTPIIRAITHSSNGSIYKSIPDKENASTPDPVSMTKFRNRAMTLSVRKSSSINNSLPASVKQETSHQEFSKRYSHRLLSDPLVKTNASPFATPSIENHSSIPVSLSSLSLTSFEGFEKELEEEENSMNRYSSNDIDHHHIESLQQCTLNPNEHK